MEKHMDNVEFSTEIFAREMCMSRSNLHIKMKALTGESANDFIRKMRFNQACKLLKEGKYSFGNQWNGGFHPPHPTSPPALKNTSLPAVRVRK